MSDSFFSRWSRQKSLQRDLHAPPTAPPAQPSGLTAPTTTAQPDAAAVPADTPAPTLDDAQALDVGADVRRYLQADVSEAARHLALKKLFADPQYNVISDMDDYVEDFSQLATLTAQEVSQLEQFKSLNPLKDPLAASPSPAPDDPSTDQTAPRAPNEATQPDEPSVTNDATPSAERAEPMPGEAPIDADSPLTSTASESPVPQADPQPPAAP
jgi:hypothetical protein